ncbi:ATP-binding protein [Tropicimonas sp. IMCC6043]|uniref:ATP-binding protein n=1 Tax=Tropicimonas sp. IMCC6043 TaxID=2510645 RepID=UPI00101CC3FA|nr:ATP-binding protein [Tropicimonas sp. IMCC6043]RYH06055.1 HAMP domain-containing protein [Tropicimonas sp. IMCC6043]
MRRLSVRARLLLALCLLAVATLTVGGISWIALDHGRAKLETLHNGTLAEVDQALTLSRQASDLATLAPYLLTLDSPFRIAQEGNAATGLLDTIAVGLPQDAPLKAVLADTRRAIADLVRETSIRAGLRDRTLRLNAELAKAERRFAALAASPTATLAERQEWIVLQRLAAALLGAGRAENLISVGEYQREVHFLVRPETAPTQVGAEDLAHLLALARGPDGLFELRRQELSRRIGAEAALVRIRQGSAAVIDFAASVTAEAQARISADRTRTMTAISIAKSTILFVGFLSASVALIAALYVSNYVTANLRAISDAMTRLAKGDRSSRLPRGEGAGDEIGKLFHAFRMFRANALRLDRSNRQMARRNALFEKTLEGINDGVAVLSETGAIIACNGRLSEVVGVEPARFEGRPFLSECIAAAGWQSVPGPGGFANLTRADGRHAEFRESRLPDGGSVVLISDATERQHLDDRLRQIQRIEALGKVSGEVAHDFGNILSTISGNLHLMETAPEARQAGLRQSIASAVEIGTSLTQRLLSFARRQRLEPERVELNTLVDGMTDLIGFALRDEISLEIRTTGAPLWVTVDPGQMESAILNLCLNAGQAIEGPGRITVSVFPEDEQVMLDVADTGAGMPPEVLAHAMEPFFTARGDGSGTGLGLAMVYGFIRQSGGDVQIDSTQGQGTRVRLSLPRHREIAQSARILWRRVLVIEDDPRDLERALTLLRPVTGRVDSCTTAGAGYETIQASVPDLVVTDLSLHGVADGWRLAEAALSRSQDTRVAVVSGRLPDINPLKARFGNRLVTLPKPLTLAALQAAFELSQTGIFKTDAS